MIRYENLPIYETVNTEPEERAPIAHENVRGATYYEETYADPPHD